MPSRSSQASWHPAFMPNSAADIFAAGAKLRPSGKSTSISPTSLLNRSDTTLKSPISGADIDVTDPSEAAIESTNGDGALQQNYVDSPPASSIESTADDTEHGYRSSGVPRSYEVLESGTGSAELHRNHEGKHLSTMSFARTVSQEVNWGEDDEVDSEWNLHRTDSDPFQSMPETDRTNSFPTVPPARIFSDHRDDPLPRTQAENILHEVESVHEDPSVSFEQTNGEVHVSEAFSHNYERRGFSTGLQDDEEEDYQNSQPSYGPSYGGDIAPEYSEKLQARYEEGLPLFNATNDQNQIGNPQTVGDSPFAEDDKADKDDFFSQVTSAKEDQQELHDEHSQPGRKSTMQVMDSLRFQPKDQTHDDRTEQKGLESSQSSLEKATGGGLGVSKSTILTDVLGNAETPIHGHSDEEWSSLFEPGEIDLASKWKEALAGDEFLDDDDDLLPDDDEPAEKPILDPATLFEDDDEGFLEDTDDQQTSDLFQQTSPPVPAPVVGPNGQIVGFNSLTGSAHTNNRQTRSSNNRYLPANSAHSISPTASSYAPAAPFLTDLSRPAASPTFSSPYASPAIPNFPTHQQEGRPEMPKAQSFAAKSKGGYTSPYDLPMEVVKPRKRVSTQSLNRGYENPPQPTAPPRSSSMYPQIPASQGNLMNAPPPRSPSFPPDHFSSTAPPSEPKALSQPPNRRSSFFEDLPISSKPRFAVRHSASSNSLRPSQYGSPQPSPLFSPNAPQFPSPLGQGPPQQSPLFSPSAPQFPSPLGQEPPPSQLPSQGLVAPARVSPYAALPSAAPPPPPPPSVASRYSPAPPQIYGQSAQPPPVSQSRYSPAPPNSRPQAPSYTAPPPISAPPVQVLPHQPRTSSPLAHFERGQDRRSYGPQGDVGRRSSSSGYDSSIRIPHLPPTRELDEDEPSTQDGDNSLGETATQFTQPTQPPPSQGMRPVSHTPPPPQGYTSKMMSPPKRATSNHLPSQPIYNAEPPQAFVPPQRSQTQSPGTAFAGPRLDMSTSEPYQRPASVEASLPLRGIVSGFSPKSTRSYNARPRGFSQGVTYVAPTDGRELDPLQRWKGAPVFVWGVGGTVVTSFPKDVPRYGLGQSMPSMIRSPGEVKVRYIKDVAPLEQRIASFPGPLKGKSKKKDLVAWLTSGLELLEHEAGYLRPTSLSLHDEKRVEERILLYKILRVFIENDGALEGSPIVEKAVRSILSPGLDDDTSATSLHATGVDLSSITQSSSRQMKADPIDSTAIDQLRRHLLRGDREKAVWEAVDKRLWAHAMLISNTVSKELYRQVAQEFIQKEVKNIGDNTESLAALYEIFAGNFEESIDELVTPSARAGFQMVRTDTTGPSKNALEGLNRWRETLALVLSNRSTDDSQALHALGNLLAGYGRAESAHVCFLFARSHSVFGGIDDSLTSIVLVGSDQLRQPYDFDRDMEPILLSEVFEYGMALSNTSNVAISSPHLSVYKLQHAKILAEYGYREKALQYCEAIASSITSQTRRSPYHHSLLVSELDDLSKRLKQSPKDDTTSWISKPSIDKVSGSVWAKFNKFVAGDENEAAAAGSTTSSGTESGPFARIAGGTPTISRSPSSSDLYAGYNGGLTINGSQAVKPAKVSPRYAPTGAYTPSKSFESQTNTSYSPRDSLDEQVPSEQRRGSHEPQRQNSDYQPHAQPGLGNPYAPQSYTPQISYTSRNSSDSYTPEVPSLYNGQHTPPVTEQQNSSFYPSPQQPHNFNSQPPQSSYTRPQPSYRPQSFSNYDPPISNGYEPHPSSGYEPSSSSGYQPPTSTPHEEPDSPVETKPKKKSFMDDNEDDNIPGLKAQSSQGREKTKAEKDREADEAFRRAAEGDAKKTEAAASSKKGWGLTGWFGGSKKELAEATPQPGKPIRAKLGEASSFVYDPELKRWINKKTGADNTPTPSANPPPPKGPPRSVSGPAGGNFTSAPRPGPVSAPTAPPPGNRSVSGGSDNAPPRAGSPMIGLGSTSSTPEPHPVLQPLQMSRQISNGSAGGPPSRPGTSMSNASSIDDLLGPPTAGGRKSAGAKKAKKGRGYVDVMVQGEKK